MLQGRDDRSGTGAVGHPYAKGRVMNVSEIEDREVISDGSLNGATGTAMWTVLGNDTINLTTSATHRTGKTALSFDKTDGAANTKNAGVYRDLGVDLGLDLSRFLLGGVVSIGIQVSAMTKVAKVHLRLGTDSSHYNAWSWNDDDLGVAGSWYDLFARIDQGTVTGNGWDPANVRYIAFFVEFDAETDALAAILIDHVMAFARAPAGARINGVTLDAVTANTDGATIDTAIFSKKTVYVNVSVNTGAVTVTIEHSPDSSTWYELDAKTYTAVTGLDSWSYESHFPYMRVTTSAQANATVTATITGRVAA